MPRELSDGWPEPEKPGKYPWDEWLVPGHGFQLHPGEDFDCRGVTMENNVRRAARSRDVKVRLTMFRPDGHKHPEPCLAVAVYLEGQEPPFKRLPRYNMEPRRHPPRLKPAKPEDT